MAYVCEELEKVKNANGLYDCKNWVLNETWVETLEITRQEMVEIGGSIIGVLALCLAFVILAKASKHL